MPIYIAKTYDEFVESIVLADSYELAQAYWQGKNVAAYTIDTRTEEDLTDHPTGVLPILNTTRKRIPSSGPDSKEYLLVKKP